MIANPPQQQIHTHHLALSLIILFLTVYPYLFNNNNTCCLVAAYSSADFHLRHKLIDEFDVLQSTDIIISRSFTQRSTDHLDQDPDHIKTDATTGPHTHQRKIRFTSLGRKFDLILNRTPHLLSKNFQVVALDKDGKQTVIPFGEDDVEILEGTLDGEPSSRATASFNKKDKLITAQIKLGHDMILVEPTYLHKDHLESSLEGDSESMRNISVLHDRSMVVYKLSDYDRYRNFSLGISSGTHQQANLCQSTRAIIDSDSLNGNGISQEQNILGDYKLNFNNRGEKGQLSKRGIEFFYDQKEQLGDKTRCTLDLVADYLFYKHVGNGDLHTTINYLLALINRVNLIYLPTQWLTGGGKSESFSNIGFTVQNLTIHQEFTRVSTGDMHYNMQSDKIWGAREFLDNFSRHSPPRHYCLAHLLTYRQFDKPVLGLAYVASTRFGTIGGICSPTHQRGDALYKHNTGISTCKGIYGETLITRQADLVMAHELGHNFGAEHDTNECRPGPAQGGAYLMHPYSVMGFEKNNRFLSECSRISIGRVIKRKGPSCFIGVVGHVCGNGVVEDDEECDGGHVGHGHSDPCCDSSCHFTPGSQCSDRHSWCCSKCHILPAGRPCRQAEEHNCKLASYCDGQSANCPSPSPPAPDDSVCVGRGLCRDGDCIPFCEARELYSCLCNNPTDACKLCCKQSLNSTCVPYDEKASYLPDGVLCYRGVCEKGRCEQPIQDVIERLWDVIEDINLTTFIKFLRDNIIIVVLLVSIPLWCLIAHLINEFDRRIKQDVINTIMKHREHRKQPATSSPFLPILFVPQENEFDPIGSYSTQV